MSRAIRGRSARLPSLAVSGLGIWGAIALLAMLALLFEPRFFQLNNLQEILRRASILGIVTMGQVLVLLTAGIDLSVGALIGVTAMIIAETTAPGGSGLAVGFLMMLVVGLGVGLTNGLLITVRRTPPFVATFGMFVVLEGARLAYTGGTVSGTVPAVLRSAGRGTLLGLPWATLCLVITVVALTVFVNRRPRGRQLVMTGANERMARLSGIQVGRLKVLAYVACSSLAVVAGVFFAGFVGYIDRFIGRGMDLDSVAAALLGGTTFSGGEGSFVRAAAGALLIVALLNLIVVAGLSVEWQFVVKGVVLIGAVALQMLTRRDPGR
ncbi:MAG TPA: ABC transporter permease [Actinomycetota bacterium]|nr:ABC transporter permease [Actinomycetota bacterium]